MASVAIEKFEIDSPGTCASSKPDAMPDVPALFAHLDLAWPLSVGVIDAGDWASTVPDRLSAWGRYGVRSDESLDEAIAAFEDAVADTCRRDPWLREHPATVTWPGGRFAPGQLLPGHGLLERPCAAVADVGGPEPETFGGPYGSDLRHYARAGDRCAAVRARRRPLRSRGRRACPDRRSARLRAGLRVAGATKLRNRLFGLIR